MSNRAEEAALKAIPNHPSDVIEKLNIQRRRFFSLGYEQAEKDTIERAISVLVNLPSLVIPSNYIAYFRKQMMEEE